ncbi:BNR repeat-containing protein [Aeoliella sp.]|uniref:BNR repeat-containing protein n=1 Tax=Aeoliella sp. TaxID=2795800 RepID=UPI003CCB838E
MLTPTMAAGEPSRFEVERALEIGLALSEFPVGFCLLTHHDQQYVAYYDQDRRMKIAARRLDSDQWQYQFLPTQVGWDSHNGIVMAVDSDGQLHISGNMHCAELIYFRTETPGDIGTLKAAPMTGERESSVTYPMFFKDHLGRLVFNYRDGRSGEGVRIYNKYDTRTRTWSRLLNEPILDGEGERNAYPVGPVLGPDNRFHLLWVWRDTPDCATNHHLSYARSNDLLNWESVGGEEVELPMKLGDQSLWVDPIPSGGGIINGGARLNFDSQNRPVVAYHKSDSDGNMQVYVARFEDDRWLRRQLTDWSKPVHFSGGGSMGFIGIRIGGLEIAQPGVFVLGYRHRDYGSGRLVIDEETLQLSQKTISRPRAYPDELSRVQSTFPDMQIRRSHDVGEQTDSAVHCFLQWESLPANQDGPRDPPLPAPSKLMLYELRATPHSAASSTGDLP